MISDATARAVIAAEMKAQDINPHGLKDKVDVPTSTLYQYFSQKRNVRLAVEVTAKILAAIGRNFAWLESQCNEIESLTETINQKLKDRRRRPATLIERKRAANKKPTKKR